MSDSSFYIVETTGCITEPNEQLSLVRVLGRGTQGTAYHIKTTRNEEYALKLYHSSTLERDTAISSRLKRLVNIGSPSDSFCWALDFVEVRHQDCSYQGYIMRLRKSDYIAPATFIGGDCEMDFKPLFKACLNLANSFAQLHLRGLCYKDVSINNFFFHPDTGSCSIIDIDNICYDNAYDYTANVLGTPRFMAPEIVEGSSKPSIYSDYHSLAVLLFYLLLRGNPLEGILETKIRIFDAAAQKHLYGANAVYVFDLNNEINRPDSEVHSATITMAHILPESIMQTFDIAFSKGLHDPSMRVPDSKWSIEFSKLIDLITHCPCCGQENFATEDESQEVVCWDCKHSYSPIRIKFLDKQYFASPGASVDVSNERLADVVRHPKEPTVLGLRNTSQQTWHVSLPDGGTSDVPPGKSFIIGPNIRVDTKRSDVKIIEIA